MKIIDADKLVEELNNPRTKYEAVINLPPRATRKDIVDTVLKAYRNILFDMISDQPAVNGWIPCSERLPEESGFYIVSLKYCKDYSATEFLYYDVEKNIFEFVADGNKEENTSWREICNCVIAWQNKPNPYKEKCND